MTLRLAEDDADPVPARLRRRLSAEDRALHQQLRARQREIRRLLVQLAAARHEARSLRQRLARRLVVLLATEALTR